MTTHKNASHYSEERLHQLMERRRQELARLSWWGRAAVDYPKPDAPSTPPTLSKPCVNASSRRLGLYRTEPISLENYS